MKPTIIFSFLFLILSSVVLGQLVNGVDWKDSISSVTMVGGTDGGFCDETEFYTSGIDNYCQYYNGLPQKINVTFNFNETKNFRITDSSFFTSNDDHCMYKRAWIYMCYESGTCELYSNTTQATNTNCNCDTNDWVGFTNPDEFFEQVSSIKYVFEPQDTSACAGTKDDTIFGREINISFDYFGHLNNYLPTFNLTANETYICLNDTQNYPVSFQLNWNIYDAEGDTIYYSYDKNELNYSKTYNFDLPLVDFKFWTSNKVTPNYKFVEDHFFFTCDLSGSLEYEENHTNLVNVKNVFDEDSYALALDGDCPGNARATLFYMEESANALSHFTYFMDFDNNEKINMTLFDETLQHEFEFNINKTDNIYFIQAKDESGNFKDVLNVSTDKDMFRLIVSNSVGDNNNYFFAFSTFEPFTANYGNITIDKNFTTYKNIEYKVEPGSLIMIDEITSVVKNFDMEWTTAQPTSVTHYRPGTDQYVFFISDNYNYPTKYSKAYLWLKSEQKEYCYSTLTGFKEDMDLIIGSDFLNYFKNLNIYDKGLKFIWIFWLFFLIFFIVTFAISTKAFHFLIPLLLSSLIGLISSLLLVSALHITTFIIFIALSVGGLYLTQRQ